jgi:stringent starvation protein B
MRISGFKKIIVTLGILVALVPALGFPASWEDTFLVIAGVVLIATAVLEWQIREVGDGVMVVEDVEDEPEILQQEEKVKEEKKDKPEDEEKESDYEDKEKGKSEWSWEGDSSHPSISF